MLIIHTEFTNVVAKLSIIEDLVLDLETDTYQVVRSELTPEDED